MTNTKHVTREQVDQIAKQVAEFIGCTVEDLFIADHTHEELPEGCWSIALEGWLYDWPFLYGEKVFENPELEVPGTFCEAGTAWYLAVYPAWED